jgi:hypothetical protein
MVALIWASLFIVGRRLFLLGCLWCIASGANEKLWAVEEALGDKALLWLAVSAIDNSTATTKAGPTMTETVI